MRGVRRNVLPVEGEIGRQGHTRQRGERGQHVEAAGKAIPRAALQRAGWPVDHRRHPHAAVIEGVFASAQRPVVAVGRRAVVAGKDDDRVVAEPGLGECRKQAGDICIHRVQHRRISPLGGIRDANVDCGQIIVFRLQRLMHDVEGHVAEKRGPRRSPQKLAGVINDQIFGVPDVVGPQFAIMPPRDRAEVSQVATREEVAAAPVVDPRLVKPVRVDTEAKPRLLARKVFPGFSKGGAVGRRVGFVAVVPFAEDAGAVARGLKHFRDRGFGGCQFAADLRPGTDSKRMPTREQHRAGRRTDTPAHAGGEFDPVGEEGVDRRSGHPAAMAGEITPADVVGQNVQHVGRGAVCGRLGRHDARDGPGEGRDVPANGPRNQARKRDRGLL